MTHGSSIDRAGKEGIVEAAKQAHSSRWCLAGRTVLVTGGAGGLGQAMVRALASSGADVAIHHLGQAPEATGLAAELAAMDRHAAVFEADVTNWRAVAEMVDRIESELGSIDVLVNNAGVMSETPFCSTSLADWERTLAVDLTGTFVCCRHVIPRMLERGAGVVVNVSSQTAFQGAPSAAAYCAAKAGVAGLTRALARELGPTIRVNAVAPGPIETPLIQPFATAEWRAQRVHGLVAGRLGVPEEVATAVAFLASDAATYMPGQCMHLNGGGVMGA